MTPGTISWRAPGVAPPIPPSVSRMSATPNCVRKSSLTTGDGTRFCRSTSRNHRPWTRLDPVQLGVGQADPGRLDLLRPPGIQYSPMSGLDDGVVRDLEPRLHRRWRPSTDRRGRHAGAGVVGLHRQRRRAAAAPPRSAPARPGPSSSRPPSTVVIASTLEEDADQRQHEARDLWNPAPRPRPRRTPARSRVSAGRLAVGALQLGVPAGAVAGISARSSRCRRPAGAATFRSWVMVTSAAPRSRWSPAPAGP